MYGGEVAETALDPALLAQRRERVFLVLAGYESSWDWREGYDVTNPTENVPYRKAAGIFQV